MKLSELAGEIKTIETKAAAAKKSGKTLSAEDKATHTRLKSSVRKISQQLEKVGVEVKVNNGVLDVTAKTLGGAATWNAAQESVAATVKQINKTREQVASLRKQPPPKKKFSEPPKAKEKKKKFGKTKTRAKPTPTLPTKKELVNINKTHRMRRSRKAYSKPRRLLSRPH